MSVIAFLGAAAPSLILACGLGFLAALGLFLLLKQRHNHAQKLMTVLGVGIAVALLAFGSMAVMNAYTTVSYGTIGLVVRFGGLTGQVFEPGLHWKTPFIDKLITIPTVVQSYETSDDPSSSGSNYTDIPVTAQTIDGQQIQVKYTVLFRIPADKAVDIVQNVGYMNDVVQNVVKAYSRNLSRLWAQNFNANDLYSGEGIFEYESSVHEALDEAFVRVGIIMDDFLVRKVDFSEDYVAAIEQKQIAQESIDTAKYNSEAAEYEKEKQIRLAEAEAERTKLLAAADAERQRLLADAEAYGIEQRGQALEKFPNLVQWEFVRNLQDVQWGILPSDGVTPLIPIPEFESPVGTPTLP
jgi:regulator of protease activity HflC (stomatin/prohibitin superfamily)